MFARIAFAVPFGAAVTACLLLVMHLMIATGEGVSDVEAAPRPVDFVRVERREVVEKRNDRPDRPEPAALPPSMPQPSTGQIATGRIEVAMAVPEISLSAARPTSLSFEPVDGEYLPLVRVAPRYPQRAAQRRLEGYVVVEFVVTPTGETRDVVVVETSSDVFNQAAIEAASKFKYQPRVVDGHAISVPAVQNRFTFKLGS